MLLYFPHLSFPLPYLPLPRFPVHLSCSQPQAAPPRTPTPVCHPVCYPVCYPPPRLPGSANFQAGKVSLDEMVEQGTVQPDPPSGSDGEADEPDEEIYATKGGMAE